MEKEKFEYKELIDLGFQREDIYDSVFFDQHGYQCFYVTKTLINNIVLDWDSTTHEIQIVRYDKNDNVLNRWHNAEKDLVLKLIEFLTDDKPTMKGIYTNAC